MTEKEFKVLKEGDEIIPTPSPAEVFLSGDVTLQTETGRCEGLPFTLIITCMNTLGLVEAKCTVCGGKEYLSKANLMSSYNPKQIEPECHKYKIDGNELND